VWVSLWIGVAVFSTYVAKFVDCCG